MQADILKGKTIEVRELDTCWGVAKGVLVAKGVKIEEIKTESSSFTASNDTQYMLKRYEKWSEARAKYYGWT